MKKRPSEPNVHEKCAERESELADKVHRLREELTGLLDPHKPYPERQALHPGNAGRAVSFWCERCRTQWPCQAVNDIRAAYGRATGWTKALAPLPPLVMEVPDEDEEQAR